jgi:DnaJ-class molecular chaperone
MTQVKKAYLTICPRCDGKGHHQRGLCFQCKGDRLIRQKSSKVMTTFQHVLTIDGQRKGLVTWGRDLADATHCAKIWMAKNGLTNKTQAEA